MWTLVPRLSKHDCGETGKRGRGRGRGWKEGQIENSRFEAEELFFTTDLRKEIEGEGKMENYFPFESIQKVIVALKICIMSQINISLPYIST